MAQGTEMKIQTCLAATGLMIANATTAQAHLGHVAEVAGHAHWIGLAAVAGAAAIAGAIGLLSGDKPDAATDAEPDAEGEAA
jgi:hypothetical protein